MTTKDEALKMAIEALEMHVPHYIKDRGCEAIQACKEALEQSSWQGNKEFVGLSDDEITNIGISCQSLHQVSRAIEQALKEKNA